jgi:NADH-quinone oxidoreductase subunit I
MSAQAPEVASGHGASLAGSTDESPRHGRPVSRVYPSTSSDRNFWDSIYLPAIFKGLWNTLFRHLLRPSKRFTVEYPEVRMPVRRGYRGEHRLKVDEQGREKCVACFMCSTACPAHCIRIVAEPAPWDDRDKHPKIFEIDLLECIYCGMCEEACPCDAIELTEVYNIPSTSREEKVYDKARLLSN